MAGEPERNDRCPMCGGQLRRGLATVPFFLPDTVALIKNVPAEICSNCHEPYMTGKVTDRIVNLLNPLRSLKAEVLILSYAEPQPVGTLAAAAQT
jgi:YgiT-type zinc finger domain-containing protein